MLTRTLGHMSTSNREPGVWEFYFWFQLNKTRGRKKEDGLRAGREREGGRGKEEMEKSHTWEVLGREAGPGLSRTPLKTPQALTDYQATQKTASPALKGGAVRSEGSGPGLRGSPSSWPAFPWCPFSSSLGADVGCGGKRPFSIRRS